MSSPSRKALTALLLCALTGCATVPRDPAALAEFKAMNDPYEPFNRRIFAFNLQVDRKVISPLARGYRRALPAKIRDDIRHLLDNLNEPVVLANCLLQGRFKSAATTTTRFVVNSTIGVAGLDDIAAGWKLPKQFGDFGQTLWHWGVAEGPYLIVPVLGPETPRDGIGQGADLYLDPLHYVPAHHNYPPGLTAGRAVVGGIDERERSLDALAEIQRESIDYYASFRSLYRQNRAAELRGEKVLPAEVPANFYDDPGR